MGLNGPGKGGVEEELDDEEEEDDDEEEDEDEDDADPAVRKIIFSGTGSPKVVRKFFFLFLFLERRERIVSGASLSSSPSPASTLCVDFKAESKESPIATDTALGSAGIEPRSCAFFRRRRRLREWVEGLPKPGGTKIGIELEDPKEE